LDDLLPDREEELSARLRKGAVREMKKRNWPPEDVQAAISAVPGHADMMLDALRSKGKKRKSWLREIYDLLSP